MQACIHTCILTCVCALALRAIMQHHACRLCVMLLCFLICQLCRCCVMTVARWASPPFTLSTTAALTADHTTHACPKGSWPNSRAAMYSPFLHWLYMGGCSQARHGPSTALASQKVDCTGWVPTGGFVPIPMVWLLTIVQTFLARVCVAPLFSVIDSVALILSFDTSFLWPLRQQARSWLSGVLCAVP